MHPVHVLLAEQAGDLPPLRVAESVRARLLDAVAAAAQLSCSASTTLFKTAAIASREQRLRDVSKSSKQQRFA